MLRPVRAAVALSALVFSLPAWAGSQADSITVGSLTLSPCQAEYGGYCGHIDRKLDPNSRVAGTIRVGFEWYPRRNTDRVSLGTISANEGGPGYSTTGSRDGYVRMLDPLRDRRDILLMDKRGTGTSDPLNCPSLQGNASLSEADYAQCGRELGAKAWLYGSAFAADDLAAVLDGLGVTKIDYYGDSYGTFFGEVFAARHPDRLRTLVLDSAYPARHLNPWFPTEYGEAPKALDLTCERTPGCPALGSPSRRLATLVAALRNDPLGGVAPDGDGRQTRVVATPKTLFTTLDLAGNSPITWRDFDAAGRAWLDERDGAPLLRLVAEGLSGAATGNAAAHEFSGALATAVICSDYTQLFDYGASLPDRHKQFAAAIEAQHARRPALYAPFTIDEAVQAPYQPLEAGVCLDWPAPPPGIAPGAPLGSAGLPNLPVLVINGELDTVTSPPEGRQAAALFPAARMILVANAIHQTAIGDGGAEVPPFGGDLALCASGIVRRFIGGNGDPGDVSCAAHVRPTRAVSAFSRLAAQVEPARAVAGNEADEPALRIASAATETIGDVVARYYVTQSGRDVGLRGGVWTLHPTATGYRFVMLNNRWTDDLTVSGVIDWNQVTGDIGATVELSGVAKGRLQVDWNDRKTDAVATLHGMIAGARVAAERSAP